MPIGRHVGAGGQSARVGPARELPPQRVVGRPPALLCGGGGPCRGHTAAPMALRRRCARRRAAECACRTAGGVGFELGWMLGAFRRRPRPALLSILSSLDSARCAVCRRFSRFPMDVPARAARHLFEELLKAGYYESDVDIPIKEENEMAKVHVAMWCGALPTPSCSATMLACRYTVASLNSGGNDGWGRLERVSDEELKGTGPPAMQHKVALGPDCGFGVRPATVQPSEMELIEEMNSGYPVGNG